VGEPTGTRFRVLVGGVETVAVHEPAPGGGGGGDGAVVVDADGAGTDMDHPALRRRCAVLRPRGLSTVRFNFLYRTAAGRGRPDPMPRLVECYEAVAETVRRECRPGRLIIGGHSMGGRAASVLAARGFDADGVLLMAYPLHPSGDPARLRDAHLSRIAAPTLCINGTRDPLCRRDLMESVVATLPGTFTMHWIEGADHSFHVLKRSGRGDDDVLEEVGDVTRAWAAGIA
jgi:predicted alpha/beta-hydrolase family hydrolase